jgi:hypothetical protein
VHLKNAVNCISNNDFEEAKNIIFNLIKIDSSVITEAYPLLQKINIKTAIKNFSYYSDMLINEFDQSSNHSELYKIFKEKKPKTLAHKIIYLKCLLILGKRLEYRQESIKVMNEIINEKFYNFFEKFNKNTNENINVENYYLVGQIIVYSEILDENKVVEILISLLKLFNKNTKRFSKVVTNISNIISDVEFRTHHGLKLKKKYALISKKIKSETATTNELKEYFYLCEEVEDYFIIIEHTKSNEIKTKIKKIINKINKVKLNTIPSFYTESVNSFKTKISITPVISNDRNDEDLIVQKELENISINSIKVNIPKVNRIDDEIQFYVDESEVLKYESVVVTLYTMGMYRSALRFADKVKDLGNQYYYKSELNYKLQNYSESIYWINKSLIDLKLNDIEKLPFLYLKALVFEDNLEENAAQKYYREILVIDPSYRNVGDRIRR